MRWFYRLTTLATVLCLCVVVLGAYVRLSDAGLGCPDWPGCYGHVTIPQHVDDVARAEARFPERPVEAAKAWKEMIHRYLASTLGLLIVIMALMRTRVRDGRLPVVLPWALVGLVIFQGMLGMWTVTWQLKPLVVTAHLLGGLTTLSMLFWLWLSTRAVMSPPAVASGVRVTPGLRRIGLLALIVLALQIFLGGWTSTNYAALGCPDFPTCHGQYWPEMDVGEAFTLWHGLGINYEFGILDNRARATIHFVHRLGAIVATVILLLFAWQLWRRSALRPYAVAVGLALGAQVVIGICVVKLQLPLWLATAHNLGASVLLQTVIAGNHRLWRSP